MSARSTYLLGLVLTCLLLLISFSLQIFEKIMPCPLCTLQRFALALLGISFLLGTLFFYSKRWMRILVSLLCILGSLLGFFLAGRQVWLQHFPLANNVECGVSLQYMLQVLPLNQVLQKIFSGTAECTARGQTFLFLTIAEWTLLWFTLFFFMTMNLLWRDVRKQ